MPLWSALKELSNDVLKMIYDVSHIFFKICTLPKAIIHAWFFHDLGSNSTDSKTDIIGMLHSC